MSIRNIAKRMSISGKPMLGLCASLLLALGVGQAVDAQTLEASPSSASIENSGETATIDVTIAGLANGLGSYNVTVAIEDDCAAEISGLASGDFFFASQDSDIAEDGKSAPLAGLGLDEGETSGSLGQVTFTGLSSGTTPCSIGLTINELTDDDGNDLAGSASLEDGTLNLTYLSNDPPTARDDSYTVDEDQTLAITEADNGVLANDSDPDDDTLTASLDNGPSSGSLTLNNDGTFTYIPDENFNGDDSFSYTASDGNGGSDSATVTITVNPVNDPPSCEDLSVEVSANTTAQIIPSCTDSEGHSLSYEIVNEPSHGDARVVAGQLEYTPNADFTGQDSFTYRADDGISSSALSAAALSNEATVSVTVTDGDTNEPPVARDDSTSTEENTPVTIDVLANDSDPDDDPLTVDSVTSPSNGSATVNSDDTVTYSPNDGFAGSDSFTYTISDDSGASDSATVNVNVGTENRSPTADAGSNQTAVQGEPVTLDGTGSSDPEGDSLNFDWTFRSKPSGSDAQLSDATSPKPRFTPDKPGNYELSLTVTDPEGASDTDRITVRVPQSGDADADGGVDALDTRICLQGALGVISLSDAQHAVCDINEDGNVDLNDVEGIAQSIIGIASSLSSASGWAGVAFAFLGLPLVLRRITCSRAKLLLLLPLMVALALTLTACPGLIPAIPEDATGLKAHVTSEAIRVEAQNMPNGGLAALQVESGGLTFNADALQVTDVQAKSNWVVLAQDIDNSTGTVSLVAAKPEGGTADDDRVLTLSISPEKNFSPGTADVQWDRSDLLLGDATNSEIADYQTGVFP